tara:strand:- start:6273 stop:6899 length:627 start_codon:yes stop_codon:yes gene_type:complete
MELILEKWQKFLNENEIPFKEIQNIIDGNQYLKGKVVADDNTVYDLGDKYFLMSGVSHLAERHQEKCFPGSLFLKGDEAIKQAVLNVVRAMPPTGGKTMAFSTGIEGLGMERLVKTTPDAVAKFEDFKMKDGTVVKIKKEGNNPGRVTDKLSVIAPSIGEAGGKPVLSLVTAFPGFMGTGNGGEDDIEIKDRADFTKNGYYFVMPESC